MQDFKRLAVISGVGFVLLIVISVALADTLGPLPPTPTESPAAQPSISQPSASSAYSAAKHYVEATLKAPSTAKFPWIDYEFGRIDGRETYAVLGYVDAQNGFGAMIRSQWGVELRHLPETDDWELVRMIIDDKQVYPQ